MEHLKKTLRYYNIDKNHIVYIAPDKPSTKYCSERPEFVRKFFSLYPNVALSTRIISDGGNGFKEDGIDVFESMGFENHYTLPSSIHQYLSVNDNKVHGIAKRQRKTQLRDRSNDIVSTLHLMYLLDEIDNKTVMQFFYNNFLLRHHEITIEACREFLAEIPINRGKFFIECLNAYRKKFTGGDVVAEEDLE